MNSRDGLIPNPTVTAGDWATRLLRRAARHAPPSLIERLEEEWLAHLSRQQRTPVRHGYRAQVRPDPRLDRRRPDASERIRRSRLSDGILLPQQTQRRLGGNRRAEHEALHVFAAKLTQLKRVAFV